MFRPVKREGVAEQVYKHLRRLIIQGRLKPGTKLPSERELARKFQVNRGAIREALSRLEENQLVSIKQGRGVLVLDWSKSFRLDFLTDLLFVNGRLNFLVFRSVLELRAILGPEMAGYAARRASSKDHQVLEKIAQELVANQNNPDRFQELEYRFNQSLAKASGNLAFEFMVNSIGELYFKNAQLFQLGIAPLQKSAVQYLQLVKAIKAKNEKQARRLMSKLFKISGKEFYKLIESSVKT